jgi:hypothetical protein
LACAVRVRASLRGVQSEAHLLEFGIPAKNLPLPLRASQRLPIFIGAALALIWTRPRILIIAMMPGVLAAIGRRYWIDITNTEFLGSSPDFNWTGYVAVLLVAGLLSQFVGCALAATVFHLLRGRQFAFGPGLDTVRRNLLALVLLAVFSAGTVVIPLLLTIGGSPSSPPAYRLPYLA